MEINMPTKEQVFDALKDVIDPEMGIDIVTLELIYNVNIENDAVNVKMTLTSPMCPFGPAIIEEVKTNVTKLGVKEVRVELTFEPLWQPSKELRATLGA